MSDKPDIARRWGFKRVLNAMGTPTILGANVSSPEVRAAVDEALQISMEIDELQAAACRAIAAATGAEAGCVTSSCSAGLAIAAAAAITGPDLARIERMPDPSGRPNRVLIPLAHDVNFGVRISQMLELAGAEVVRIGSANHCDGFHLRGALDDRAAAVFYIDTGEVNPVGHFPTVEECVDIADRHGVPVVVDTAAGLDVRPFLEAGASLVITSAHKQMGAPTSGVLCGKLDFVRACYLQNYGIGRAMKVGKEGIVGAMAAVDAWYSRDPQQQAAHWDAVAQALRENLKIEPGPRPSVAVCRLPPGVGARALANRLREGDPPVWVRAADDERGELHLDLRVMTAEDARRVGARIADAVAAPKAPEEDVPFHDLYWSERRLLEWPNWR